jgi:hypothetical protein
MNPERILKMSRERFSNPNDESYEDTVQFRIRFKYVGPRDNKNRQFCSDMLAKNRVYRMEDIEQLSNPEFGNYDIFTWRGSFNCRHTWVKLVFQPDGKIRNSGDSTRGLIQTDPLSSGLQPDTRPGPTIRSADQGRGRDQWKEGMPRTGPNLFAEMDECPPATLDIPLNIANRQKCIDQANYGPLNPNLPNDSYWKKKADQFNTTPEEAKKILREAVTNYVSDGWNIEIENENDVVLGRKAKFQWVGKLVIFLLLLLIFAPLAIFYLIVVIVRGVTAKPARLHIWVDKDGRIQRS